MISAFQRQLTPRFSRAVVFALGISAAGGLVSTQALLASTEDAFAPCEEQVEARSDEYESYLCFYRSALQTGRFEAAAGRLQAHRAALEARGENRGGRYAWPALVTGFLVQGGASERALELYEEAAVGFREADLGRGEVLARANSRHLLVRLGRLDEATVQVDLAVEASARSDDEEAIVRAAILEARHLVELGRELGRAERALKRASLRLFPNGSASLRRSALFTQGQLDSTLGRHEDSARAYERYLEVLSETGDSFNVANVRFNIGHERLLQARQQPRRAQLDQIVDTISVALEEATTQGAVDAEVRALGLLGELLRFRDPERARELVVRCSERARSLRRPDLVVACSWAEAQLLAIGQIDQAIAASDRAIATAIDSGKDPWLARSRMVRMRLDWQHLPAREAARRSLESLAAIEALRSAQLDPMARAFWFTNWAHDYRWLVGKILDQEAPDVAVAFEVGERLRARVLLDQVARAQTSRTTSNGTDPGASQGLDTRHLEIAEAIAESQRRLLDPRLEDADRAESMKRLVELELEEAEQRWKSEERVDGPATLESRIAALEQVQEALEPEEAMLLYHLGPWEDIHGKFGGGSWLTVVTRSSADVVRLPDSEALESSIPVFEGLFGRRDGLEPQVGAELFRGLLAPALDLLPESVDRLVVVPDGVIERLPLDALAGEGDHRIGESHRLAVAPSASLWLRWRQSTPNEAEEVLAESASRRALVIADPDFELVDDRKREARTRNLVLAEGMTLGRLPFARREGRAIARRLGRRSTTVLVGGEASEDRFKRLVSEDGLDDFELLHFAAHAVSDQEHPHRSAIVLASEGGAEDGLLQPREIARLRLSGQLVVLSACRTADGAMLRGEGPMSLARVFLEAGASAVIGTRWPLQDDEGEWLFGRLYSSLADGMDVATALREVKREAVAVGMPAAGWAGLVLIGDGAKTLRLEESASGWQKPRLLIGAGTVLALLTVAVLWANRRRVG